MTLTPSQRRSWARHGARELQRTIDAAKADIAAAEMPEPVRAPRLPPVDLTGVEPGDQVELASGALITVAKVNRKSITSIHGTRWTAAEIMRVVKR